VHRIGRTGRAAATGDAYTFMSPDEISMVRTIERMIGQQIPRISVRGYDFGTTADDTLATPAESVAADIPLLASVSAEPDQVATQKRYRQPRGVARRR
jgi:superfamily II DNA/RNA helicase